MSEAGERDSSAPDESAQRAILLFAIVSGAALLIAHEALADKAAWFDSRLLRCVWLTLATALPLFAALSVQRLDDRRFWLGVGSYALLLGYLAFYAGRAMEPASVAADAVAAPYVCALIASGHVLSAWFAVSLRREGYAYPLLFEAAWRIVSTLAQVLAYTAAFWLLLVLWAALFKALGIDFFRELFELPRFIYPVTSLVAGYGLVIARTKSSLGDAVHLRILALWRGLLPLASLLALAFASALLLRGVEPLWATRHATQLLLALIFALVALANAAYGKGGEAQPRAVIRGLVTAALVLLPLFVALAAWALGLRWRQYGLSLDRLWAALTVLVAAVYAGGYAVAALRRGPVWLSGIAPVNRFVSLFGAGLLLLTQTGALDFRAITAHTLLERGAALKDEDLRYLRWELGHPGLYALQRLQEQAKAERAAQIGELIARQQRWAPAPLTGHGPPRLRLASDLGPLPEGLQHFAETHVNGGQGRSNDCGAPAECWLLRADLIPGGESEWLRLRLPAAGLGDESLMLQLEVLKPCVQGWCVGEAGEIWRKPSQVQALRAELEAGRYRPAPAQRLDLEVGRERLEFWR